ncbi:MAG TPA: hypothetical protein VFR15_14240 [Chloroflexia bacterium]|nr:hypothetical protein [Chloroflexia bacterium]
MIPDSIRERLDEREIEFLEMALEVYAERGGDDNLMAGSIARSLKWRITPAELNKFVRRLHSRGFVLSPKTVAGGPSFRLDPSITGAE